MDAYTLGRLVFPIVIGIMALAVVLTLIMGFFAMLKTLESARRFFQTLEKEQRPLFTINVTTRRPSLKPPMREKE